MDLLGLFKERNNFLEIKYVFPQNPLATLDPPVPDRLRPNALRLACSRAAIGPRTRSRDGRCGWVLSGPVCGLGEEWRAAPDSGGSVAVTPACGPSCTEWSPAASKAAQGVRQNVPKGDGGGSRPCRWRGPTALGVWSPHDSLTSSPRVAGSKGHTPRATAVVAWSARRGRGDDGAAVVLAPHPRAVVCATACAR
jgi:hypothetical protein